MRIFVAFGFNDRDKWIEYYVVPLIRAFGSEVVMGDDVYGEDLSQAVPDRIKTCDALIGFTTRRFADDKVTLSNETHWWVIQELQIAEDAGKKTLEVREDGLAKQKGTRENKQRIKYDPADVIACIIKIAAALGEWHKKEAAQFLLMRDVLYEEIASQLEADSFRCRYRVQRGNSYDAWEAGRVVRRNKRLYFVPPRPLPEGSSVQVSISAGGKSYSSDLEDVRTDSIPLSQESPLVLGLADSPAAALYR